MLSYAIATPQLQGSSQEEGVLNCRALPPKHGGGSVGRCLKIRQRPWPTRTYASHGAEPDRLPATSHGPYGRRHFFAWYDVYCDHPGGWFYRRKRGEGERRSSPAQGRIPGGAHPDGLQGPNQRRSVTRRKSLRKGLM